MHILVLTIFIVLILVIHLIEVRFSDSTHEIGDIKKHLEVICASPRITGSKEEQTTIRYIQNYLDGIISKYDSLDVQERLFDVELEVEKFDGEYFYKPRKGLIQYNNLQNILLRIRPRQVENKKKGIVMISSHFDSAFAAVGCWDDGIPVAVGMELARSILNDNSLHLTHELWIFFNDAEELWLLGSEHFSEKFKNENIVFLNLEAGGVGGKEIILRSNDYFVMKQWSKTIKTAVASFMAGDVFQYGLKLSSAHIPVTDMITYHDVGKFCGVDTCFVQSLPQYHTREDNLESVDYRSVNNMLDNSFTFVETFGVFENDFPDSKVKEFPFFMEIFEYLFVFKFWVVKLYYFILLILVCFSFYNSNIKISDFTSRLMKGLFVLFCNGMISIGLTVGFSIIVNFLNPMFYYSSQCCFSVAIYLVVTFCSFMISIKIISTSDINYYFVLLMVFTAMMSVGLFTDSLSPFIFSFFVITYLFSKNLFPNSPKVVKDKVLAPKDKRVFKIIRAILLNVGSFFLLEDIINFSRVIFTLGGVIPPIFSFISFDYVSAFVMSFLLFFVVVGSLFIVNGEYLSKKKFSSLIFSLTGPLLLCIVMAVLVPSYTEQTPKKILAQEFIESEKTYILLGSTNEIELDNYVDLKDFIKTDEKRQQWTFNHMESKNKYMYYKEVDHELTIPQIDLDFTTHEEKDMIRYEFNIKTDDSQGLWFQRIVFDVEEINNWSLKAKEWESIKKKHGEYYFLQTYGCGEKKESSFWIEIPKNEPLKVKVFSFFEKIWGEEFKEMVNSFPKTAFAVPVTIVVKEIVI